MTPADIAGIIGAGVTVIQGGVQLYGWLKKKYFSSTSKDASALLNHVVDLLSDRIDYLSTLTTCSTKSCDVWVTEMKKIVAESSNASNDDQKKKLIKDGIELLVGGNKFQQFFLKNPEKVKHIPASPDMNKFETQKAALDELIDLVKDEKCHRIGIQGSWGTGKTSLMQNLNNSKDVAPLFDIVIWLNISSTEERNKRSEVLQQEIIERLNIEGTNNSGGDAKTRILKNLKHQKFLLLLDDLNEKINLSQLGIPFPDENNGSKVVMTTRKRHVILPTPNEESTKIQLIEMKPLSKGEPWKIFEDIVQHQEKILENFVIRRLAVRLCKECGKNPRVIKTVATTFKNYHDDSFWTKGLMSWRLWPKNDRKNMMELFELLEKYCLEPLAGDMKKCFYYSALYEEYSDIYKENLLECWAAEEFLQDHECPAAELEFLQDNNHEYYIKGNMILKDLKDVALLEQGKSPDYVRIHECFRQLALFMSSKDPESKPLVFTRGELPKVEHWEDKKRISLINQNFQQLPDHPNCEMLSTLLIQKNSYLELIPESFFDHMEKLRVLEFLRTGITSLQPVKPSSSKKLSHLKVLNVMECKSLVELAIEELDHLEALDIRGSGINNNPTPIGKLPASLRILRFSLYCIDRSIINSMLDGLEALETLVVDVTSLKHCWSNDVVKDIIEKVKTLKNFRCLNFLVSNEVVDVIKAEDKCLQIYVPQADILQTFINGNCSLTNARSFVFVIGPNNSFDQFFIDGKNSKQPEILKHSDYEKFVKYWDGEDHDHSILEALPKADAFELVRHKNIKQLSDFPATSMIKVRSCLVKSCNTIETIVGTTGNVLQNLEHLYIKDVPKLNSISNGSMQDGSLSKLTTLVFNNCPKLEKIFPHQNQEVLPNLMELKLLNLPKLKSIYPDKSLEWPSLRNLEIYECPKLSKLPFKKEKRRKLKINSDKAWK